MADSDLIDFNVIEEHKENIQALPSGRSAKALAQLYSPPLSGQPHAQDVHSSKRAEFEQEVAQIEDADDPLDVYDRYVKWTLDAHPSAQATPQSQLLPLLERATKAFLQSPHYKNDPRYLRIWLKYIHLFSDAPRETFVFLARQGVGETLALYYEEFAAWLETAGRWSQAEEVYKIGLEKEARPTERLMRKFGEFERRKDTIPQDVPQPTSPVIPAMRPALAAKIDPFASHAASTEEGAQQAGSRTAAGKKKSNKMAIFSDEGESPQSVLGSKDDGKAWDSIGSLQSRKKENAVEPKAWAGETLKTGKTNTGVPKMAIFKSSISSPPASKSKRSYETSNHESQRVINPKTGRAECVFVNLEAVYPDPRDPSLEFCFEELRARQRGWLERDWALDRATTRLDSPKAPERKPKKHHGFEIFEDPTQSEPLPLPQVVQVPDVVGIDTSLKVLKIHDENAENNENAPPSKEEVALAKRLRREERANKTRRIKVMEVEHVKKETQTVQLNLASPTGPKMKRKKSAEPTMTINTKEAMDEIYGIFSQPVKTEDEKTEQEDDDDDSDDDYTSGAESTTTGKMSANVSEYGDETRNELLVAQGQVPVEAEEEVEENADVTGWSDFTSSKHVPKVEDQDENTENAPPPRNDKIQIFQDNDEAQEDDAVATPQDEDLITPMGHEATAEIKYIPLPPEDYEPVTSQFRNSTLLAQNRLPFMTPIVERTESSLGAATVRTEKDYFTSKTPCRQTQELIDEIDEDGDDGTWSSPFQDHASIAEDKRRILQPIRTKTTKGIVTLKDAPTKSKPLGRSIPSTTDSVNKGPIIKDLQCNPVDPNLRESILAQLKPSLTSYEGYHEHLDTRFGRGAEIRKYTSKVSKASKGPNGQDKTASTLSLPPILDFKGTDNVYTVKRELGAGAFAPVYLVDRSDSTSVSHKEYEDVENVLPVAQMGKGAFAAVQRDTLEAIKLEDNPPSAWEFYMIKQTHRRLGVSRPAESIVHAHEMHIFADEGYLVEQFRDQGTLLDLVNLARADAAMTSNPSASGGMDESLAMFFSIELLRTVEALHARGIIHGDIKGDNVLVRFESPENLEQQSQQDWSTHYMRDGTQGWAAKGITLIDFGRGIDMRVFSPQVAFIADWETSEADCAEMRELRPWTYQVDYHGLAGTIHSLLFGKYMVVVPDKTGGAASGGVGLGQGNTKRYKIKEGLKRYWQTDIWAECFETLLNPLAKLDREEAEKLPITRGIRDVRERMEGWLEANCDKGVGLKGMIRRLEDGIVARRRR